MTRADQFFFHVLERLQNTNQKKKKLGRGECFFPWKWKVAKEGKEREEETVCMKMAKVLSCRVLEGTSVGILLSGTD